MKVTATQPGFIHGHLKSPGAHFEIPDTPTRKLTSADDAMTRAIAVKNQVPVAFSASWMRPGWEAFEQAPVPGQAHLQPPPATGEDAIDLNHDVI